MVLAVVPDLLWHYTTLDSLEKILGSRSIRATHAGHLNDPREFHLVFDAYDDALRLAWPDRVADLSTFHNRRDPLYRLTPFAVSLSENQDNLLLWRSYADSLTGVALGIRAAGLTQLKTSRDDYGVKLHQVSYDQDKTLLAGQSWALETIGAVTRNDAKHDAVRAELPAGYPAPKAFGRRLEEDHIVADHFVGLAEIAATFKTSGWRQEEEWRLLVQTTRPLWDAAYEDAADTFENAWTKRPDGIPFVTLEVPAWEDLLPAVVVGPHGNAEGVQALLERLGLSASVSQSPTLVRAPSKPSHSHAAGDDV